MPTGSLPTRSLPGRAADLATAKQRGYLSIGRAAASSEVTPKMIRHYESLGLIPPAKRTSGDYRVYTANDVHALRFIRRARGLGFSTKQIQALLDLWRKPRRGSVDVKRLASKHLAELDRKIADLQLMRATLADLVAKCHGDDRPECPILDDLGDDARRHP